jgi:hypothetical protein
MKRSSRTGIILDDSINLVTSTSEFVCIVHEYNL